MNYTKYVKHIADSLDFADREQSKLTTVEKMRIVGLSTSRVRCLVNNLCNMKGTVYLEVGVYRGATFIAANYENNIKAIGIDNFCYNPMDKDPWNFEEGFENVRLGFEDNVGRYKNNNRFNQNYQLVRGDVKEVELDLDEKITTVFYDAAMDLVSLNAFLGNFKKHFSDPVTIAFMDFTNTETRENIAEAIENNGYKIEHHDYIWSKGASDQIWWSGVGVYLLVPMEETKKVSGEHPMFKLPEKKEE